MVLFVLAQLPAGGSGCPVQNGAPSVSCCCEEVPEPVASCCTETESPQTDNDCACGISADTAANDLMSVRDTSSPNLTVLTLRSHAYDILPLSEATCLRGLHNDAGPPGHVPTYILHCAILR